MHYLRRSVVVGAMLATICACSAVDQTGGELGTRETFSLCPKTEDALLEIRKQAHSLAEMLDATLIDRSAAVQQELFSLNSPVLARTGGPPLLITVEKEERFRVSIANLGLREKVGLSIRTFNESDPRDSLAAFFAELGDSWIIQESSDNVMDDPPCA